MSENIRNIIFCVLMLVCLAAMFGAGQVIYSLVVWFRFITGA